MIHYMSDFIVVINRGRIVEQGEGSQLIRTPKDDYTKRLIASSCSTGRAVYAVYGNRLLGVLSGKRSL